MNTLFTTLAQTQPAAVPTPAASSFLNMNNIFWATIFLIFLITIIAAFLRRLAKDKALKLFHKYHVSFLAENRPTTWGDLAVFSQGVELLFDQPYKTSRGLVKSSSLIYEDEFATMICMTRSVHGLSARETAHRKAQIDRTFYPNFFHRAQRWFRNALNTLRDAISKTMSLVIGKMTGGVGAGAVISTQANDINALTGSVINLAANAYEPLLERYIGKPVVVELVVPQLPGAAAPPPGMANTVEFPGYLVDYTQRFLAVFNVDHDPMETIEIHLDRNKPAEPNLPDLTFTMSDVSCIINCVGRDAFVVRRICCGEIDSDLGVALVPGTTLVLDPINKATTITVERTRNIDLLVPRTRARIHFASVLHSERHGPKRHNWSGLAPRLDHGDRSAPSSSIARQPAVKPPGATSSPKQHAVAEATGNQAAEGGSPGVPSIPSRS